MNNIRILCHSVWDCKYHIVWIPKYRRKTMYGQIRIHLGKVIRELARQRECQALEGHICSDHVIAIPPKYAVRTVIEEERQLSGSYFGGATEPE
jgi:putative transposase